MLTAACVKEGPDWAAKPSSGWDCLLAKAIPE
jgi:hypothetical protein